MQKQKSIVYCIELVGYFFLINIVILLTFRQARALFPIPEIGSLNIVSYAQFNGYPLYFDNLLFFLLLLSPVIAYFFSCLRRRYVHK